ncbi:MAG: helix-turn-helix domain-containing protein [Parvibaculaceae bacterium]|nr:helix-turn-helix domain-containing protein [Parvibaculaceae bacterium]
MAEPTVEPVLRSLTVLKMLNRRSITTLSTLHDETGLPKSTLVRLLDTLIAGGYVSRLHRRRGYQLTDRVLHLARGYQFSDPVIQAARPVLEKLTQKFKWPFTICTLQGSHMRIRFSTTFHAPMADESDYAHDRVPLLPSAMGQAYLAFCSEEERKILLRMVQKSENANDLLSRDTRFVTKLLATVAERGYANTLKVGDLRLSGMAIPIIVEDQVRATFTLRHYTSAMTAEEAATLYLSRMQDAAREISAAALEMEQAIHP